MMAPAGATAPRDPQLGRGVDGIILALHAHQAEEMPSLTIRLRSDDDADAVERLKAATGEATASGAIWRAIREWPRLVEQLRAQHERSKWLADAVTALVAAEDAIQHANTKRADALEFARHVQQRHALPQDAGADD